MRDELRALQEQHDAATEELRAVRRAGKDAEETRARLAAIVESSDDAIVSKTLDGTITSWNRAAEQMFGYSAGEAVGRHITLIIPSERRGEEDDVLARLRRGEKVDHFETVRQAKDGRRLTISLTVSPIRDTAGRVIGASKVARDISERKHAEEALRESDRHKNEFLAMLAHELRNPLAPICSSLEVLRRLAGEPSEPAASGTPGAPAVDSRRVLASALETMERQVGHMVRLVDDLLDLARISRGRIALRWGRVELASVVRHAVEAVRSLCDSMGHELMVTLPPQPVCLDGDPTRLAQIVSNLLNNACKYTPRGGRIWLTVGEDPSAHGSRPGVVISVRDTGVGIAPEQLPRMFDAFTQADSSLESTGSGLGIGLALVKTLVQMHGGTVEARSAGTGQGSEFVVRLPTAAEAPPPGPAATTAATAEPTAAAPRRILVVDDHRDSAESLAMLLELHGHEAHQAHDGPEAVEAATRLRPDVILLDIGLPTLNGYETARRIRERLEGKRLLLVALTGWGQEEDRRRSEEAGFDAHLVKPVDYRALAKVLVDAGAD